MLPRTLHIEQINRFHDEFEKLSIKIKKETDKDKRLELSLKYFEMTKVWEALDEFVEFKLKHELDILIR